MALSPSNSSSILEQLVLKGLTFRTCHFGSVSGVSWKDNVTNENEEVRARTGQQSREHSH